MAYRRLAAVLALAACSSTAPQHAAEPADPPAMPERMLAVDFAALVAHRVLAPIELPVVSRAEDDTLFGDTAPAAPGTLELSNAAPGGWSQTVYADGAHRLWIVSRTNQVHVPDGVIISATHVWTTTVSIPRGYVLGGNISVIGSS
jgi:hypothetical protein